MNFELCQNNPRVQGLQQVFYCKIRQVPLKAREARNMKAKWERPAMRFASARYLDRPAMLDVLFENGDHFVVAAETVVPRNTNGKQAPGGGAISVSKVEGLDWAKMRIGETRDVLEIPARDEVVEIPWDCIRSVADPAFRAHWAEQVRHRARRLGRRIQAMRRQVRMSPAALAATVGVRRELIVNLEAGTISPSSDLLEHIASALGRPLKDFAQP